MITGITTDLRAARYSASARGWSVLDQAIFTVVPVPGEEPYNICFKTSADIQTVIPVSSGAPVPGKKLPPS